MEEYERLRQRFVRGEISVDEYERRLKALHKPLSQDDLDHIAAARARAREGAFVLTTRKGAAPPPLSIPHLASPRRRVSRYVPIAGGCLMILAALCALTSAVGGIIAAFDGGDDEHDPPSHSSSNQIAETFTVGARPTIRIHNDDGNVRVVPGEPGQVNVRADTDLSPDPGPGPGGSPGRFSAEQNGDTINIDASAGGGPFWFARRDGGTHLVLRVPPESSLDLELNNGDIHLEGVTGEIRTDVDDGNVRLDATTVSDHSSIEVDNGNVDIIGKIPPDTELDITVNNGYVQLTIPRDSDAQLEASTDSGSISVDDLPIAVTREGSRATAFGSLTSDPTGRIEIEVDNGSISLSARD